MIVPAPPAPLFQGIAGGCAAEVPFRHGYWTLGSSCVVPLAADAADTTALAIARKRRKLAELREATPPELTSADGKTAGLEQPSDSASGAAGWRAVVLNLRGAPPPPKRAAFRNLEAVNRQGKRAAKRARPVELSEGEEGMLAEAHEVHSSDGERVLTFGAFDGCADDADQPLIFPMSISRSSSPTLLRPAQPGSDDDDDEGISAMRDASLRVEMAACSLAIFGDGVHEGVATGPSLDDIIPPLALVEAATLIHGPSELIMSDAAQAATAAAHAERSSEAPSETELDAEMSSLIAPPSGSDDGLDLASLASHVSRISSALSQSAPPVSRDPISDGRDPISDALSESARSISPARLSATLDGQHDHPAPPQPVPAIPDSASPVPFACPPREPLPPSSRELLPPPSPSPSARNLAISTTTSPSLAPQPELAGSDGAPCQAAVDAVDSADARSPRALSPHPAPVVASVERAANSACSPVEDLMSRELQILLAIPSASLVQLFA